MRSTGTNKIILNNIDNSEGLIQEIYNDANGVIKESNDALIEMSNNANQKADNVDDYVKISKAKSEHLKMKDSAIKIKLELVKLQLALINKDKGNDDDTNKKKESEGFSLKDMKNVKKMIETMKQEETKTTEEYQIRNNGLKAKEDTD